MSVPYKQCPRCGTTAELTAPVCQQCGRQYRTQFVPPPAPPATEQTQAWTAPVPPTAAPVAQKTDLYAVLALAFGTLGILSFGGCLFAPAAFILSQVSLARIQNNPGLKGRTEARIACALGILGVLIVGWQLRSALSPNQPADNSALTPAGISAPGAWPNGGPCGDCVTRDYREGGARYVECERGHLFRNEGTEASPFWVPQR